MIGSLRSGCGRLAYGAVGSEIRLGGVGDLSTEPANGQRVWRVSWSIPPMDVRSTLIAAASAEDARRLVVSLEPRARVHRVRLEP